MFKRLKPHGSKKTILAICLFLVVLTPATAVFAESYSVTATVPSPVSASQTKSNVNTTSTLADPASHSFLVTINVEDASGAPLANKLVEAYSSRGSVDIIEATSKLSGFRAQAAEVVGDLTIPDIQKDYTDDNGRVSFRLTSFVAGDVDLKFIADKVVELKPVSLKFLPLPFPMYLTVVVNFPLFSNKEWTLVNGQYQSGNLSALQRQKANEVNPGAKIFISWYIFFPVVALILLVVVLLLIGGYNIVLARRLRQEEKVLVGEIAVSSDISKLKETITSELRKRL